MKLTITASRNFCVSKKKLVGISIIIPYLLNEYFIFAFLARKVNMNPTISEFFTKITKI